MLVRWYVLGAGEGKLVSFLQCLNACRSHTILTACGSIPLDTQFCVLGGEDFFPFRCVGSQRCESTADICVLAGSLCFLAVCGCVSLMGAWLLAVRVRC